VGKHRLKKKRAYSVVAVIGELMITAGLVLGAYVVYELYVSNFAAEQTWSQSTDELEDQFDKESKELLKENPSLDLSNLVLEPNQGQPFGFMLIPKLWASNKAVPILAGIADRDLARGLGHYSDTAMPGEEGNFSVAGHRATHGQPFAQFQNLAKGDEVIVETLAGRYVYSLVTDIKVTPTDVWVISPKPDLPELNALPADIKLITLTTCDPRWSSEFRWIWFGALQSFTPRSEIEASA
jgi:sortase A